MDILLAAVRGMFAAWFIIISFTVLFITGFELVKIIQKIAEKHQKTNKK